MAIEIDEEMSAKYAGIKCLRFTDESRYGVPWTSVSLKKGERLAVIGDSESEEPDLKLLVRIEGNDVLHPTFACDEETLHRGQFKVVR